MTVHLELEVGGRLRPRVRRQERHRQRRRRRARRARSRRHAGRCAPPSTRRTAPRSSWSRAPDESDPAAGTAALAPAHRAAGRGHRHGQGAAGVGRRTPQTWSAPRSWPAAWPSGTWPRGATTVPTVVSLDPRLPAAVDQALADLAALAHRRPGAPRTGRGRRRCAVVHDALRPRLAADRLDDPALRRLSRRRGAGQPGRPPGPRGRPGVGGAARPDPPRAAPARRQRRVLVPEPLLRHRRRHPALRRPRRRGVAVAGHRRGGARSAWRRPSAAPSTGSSDPATPTATASSTTGGATRAGSPTRAGRTRGTASPAPTARCPTAPLALVEVQGYAYAALRGAAALAEVVDIGHSRRRPPPPGRERSRTGSTRPSGTGAAGSCSASTPTARPSTRSPPTPGTRCGPASPTTTRRGRYVERLVDPDLWTGWGLRTLAARWRRTTRSATTTARCGRTTPRCASPAPRATAAGTPST